MAGMRQLTLSEYRTATGVSLSGHEVIGLRRAVPSLRIQPSLTRAGAFDLTPGSHVGAVMLGDLDVQIRPKLPIDRLCFLISYASGAPSAPVGDALVAEAEDLTSLVAVTFASQVRRALQRGVLQGYRRRDEALLTVRGRVRFADQLRRWYSLSIPVEVSYDEFTEDIEENRDLKAALARLQRVRLRSSYARRAVRQFEALLAEVQPVEYRPDRIPEIRFDRLNQRYQSAIELGRLILRSTSFELQHGAIRTSAFLIDMNRVFEDFVVVAVREALGLSERTLVQGCRGRFLRLDRGGSVRLEPDLSWWEAGRCLFVGDAKYKRIETAVPNADLYQLLAYTTAANLPSGMLVYAAGEATTGTYQVMHTGKRLHVLSLDLACSPAQILEQVHGLATSISGSRPMLSTLTAGA